MLRTPTSALLERVEQHINRLDQTLKETEELLSSLRSGDREDWIRQLQGRLAAGTHNETDDAEVAFKAPPYRRP